VEDVGNLEARYCSFKLSLLSLLSPWLKDKDILLLIRLQFLNIICRSQHVTVSHHLSFLNIMCLDVLYFLTTLVDSRSFVYIERFSILCLRPRGCTRLRSVIPTEESI